MPENILDARNIEALAVGPIPILEAFVNLLDDPTDPSQPELFLHSYGVLHPEFPLERYWGEAHQFRQWWVAKTPNEIGRANAHLQQIFERELGLPTVYGMDAPASRPAIVVDFAKGRIGVKPRTLFDILALTLLTYRKKLAVCESRDCPHPYYVKAHARQRFCSDECADTIRGRKKKQWQVDHREELAASKRRARAKQRRSKGRRRAANRRKGRAKAARSY